jgi:hypothetical protein
VEQLCGNTTVDLGRRLGVCSRRLGAHANNHTVAHSDARTDSYTCANRYTITNNHAHIDSNASTDSYGNGHSTTGHTHANDHTYTSAYVNSFTTHRRGHRSADGGQRDDRGWQG